MTSQSRPRVIALEEHYWDREIAATFAPEEFNARAPSLIDRLYDYSELRIAEMDEAGIDVQVLSQGAPATQRLDGPTAIRLAHDANDRLREIVRSNPSRFAASPACRRPTRPQLQTSWSAASPSSISRAR